MKARVLGVSERQEQSDARFGKKKICISYIMLVTTQNMMVTTQNMFHLIESVDFITRLHIIKQKRMKGTCHIKLAMTNI